jgi:uncharacterized membrane protein YphA (DoxX/SURF4 family)
MAFHSLFILGFHTSFFKLALFGFLLSITFRLLSFSDF